MSRPVCALLCFLLISLLPAGCRTAYHTYSPTATVDQTDPRTITEDDIRTAYDAAPQLRPPVKVAWYNTGTDQPMASLMRPDAGVALHYEIPKILVEGARPFFESSPGYERYSTYYTRPQPIDPKALRLLAARAKCDVLVIVGSRFETEADPNGWAACNPLLVPVFLTPWQDVKYHHEAEALVFDVRNGYLYKHAQAVSDETRRLTIWETEATQKRMESDLREKARQRLDQEIYGLFHER